MLSDYQIIHSVLFITFWLCYFYIRALNILLLWINLFTMPWVTVNWPDTTLFHYGIFSRFNPTAYHAEPSLKQTGCWWRFSQESLPRELTKRILQMLLHSGHPGVGVHHFKAAMQSLFPEVTTGWGCNGCGCYYGENNDRWSRFTLSVFVGVGSCRRVPTHAAWCNITSFIEQASGE